MNNDYTMSVNNKRVWDFYNENPHLDFESLHVLFIEMMEKSINKITQNNSSVISQLLTYLKDNQPYNESANFNKYNNNGKFELYSLLNKEYPSSDITIQSRNFIMKRIDKPVIILENKENDTITDKDEIAKFIKDIEVQNINGIFMSQHSGISLKNNYQIEIHNGNVLVYIHNCDYSPDKIKIAVDIIDSMSVKIKDLNMDEENSISQEVLDEINKEYQEFILQKENSLVMLRDFQRKMTTQIESIKLPSLEKYLEPKYTHCSTVKIFTCELCNIYTANSKQSLSAHRRGCIKKHKPLDNSVVSTA
jgi:hypothetical protein